jgi:hypothetical protein
MKQADLMDTFKKASKSVYTTTIVVSPDPLSPTLSTSSAMETSENTEQDHDTLNQQMREIHEWSTPLISCTAHL